MKKWLVGCGVAVLLFALTVAPGWAATRFWLQGQGDNLEAITSGRCLVLTAGANTLAGSIFTTNALTTAATNPVAMSTTTGVCEWFGATATTAFDVILVVDSGPYKGARVRVDNVTNTGQHMVKVGRQHGLKVLLIPYPAAAAATATTDTRTLPPGAVVDRVTLMTTTAVANSSIALGVGSNGSESNLCDGAAPPSGQPGRFSYTGAVGFSQCGAALGEVPLLKTLVGDSTSQAIRIHNQNHATAGFAFVWYFESGNEP